MSYEANPRWSLWRTLAALGATALVSVLVAKQFIGEGGWVDSVAQVSALLVGLGIAFEVATTRSGRAAYRAGIAMALAGTIGLVVANGAVGIIGSENDPINRWYLLVLAVGAVGALVARLRPSGMARTMVAAAVAQGSIAAIALIGGLGGPGSDPVEILAVNGAFVAVFSGSALLFTRAISSAVERTGPAEA